MINHGDVSQDGTNRMATLVHIIVVYGSRLSLSFT